MKKTTLLCLFALPVTAYGLDPYDNFPVPQGNYFLNYTAAYIANRFADQDGRKHKIDQVTVLKNVFRYANYYEAGGLPAVTTVLVPVTQVKASGSKDEGLGDIIFGNGIWFYNSDNLHSSVSLFVQMPTGHHNVNNPASVGSKTWQVTPGLNMVYVSNGYNIEASLKRNMSSENNNSRVQLGSEAVFEVYAGHVVGAYQYGLHYNMRRGTDASLNDVRLASSGIESDQVGASLLWNFSSGGLSFEYFKDVNARNALLGETFLVRYNHKFQGTSKNSLSL